MSRLAGCGEKESGAFLSLLKSRPEGEEPWSRLGTAQLTWLPPFGQPDAPLFSLETDCVRELLLRFLIDRQQLPAGKLAVPLSCALSMSCVEQMRTAASRLCTSRRAGPVVALPD